MAKGTKAQEVSTGTPDSYTPDELADPTPPIRIQRAMLGVVPEEVTSSVGTHSSPSSENENSKSDNENPSPPPPVPTTENPSSQPGSVTDSDAALMVGSGQTPVEPPPFDEEDDEEDDEESEETPEPVAKKATPAKKTAAPKKARTRSTGDDFDF